jgi:hypothetical protein
LEDEGWTSVGPRWNFLGLRLLSDHRNDSLAHESTKGGGTSALYDWDNGTSARRAQWLCSLVASYRWATALQPESKPPSSKAAVTILLELGSAAFIPDRSTDEFLKVPPFWDPHKSETLEVYDLSHYVQEFGRVGYAPQCQPSPCRTNHSNRVMNGLLLYPCAAFRCCINASQLANGSPHV